MRRIMVPRPAATVIAARPGARGVEVLVVRRGSGHRFLPGYVVFPGGAVDEEDAELAARWFGSGSEAARACAIRELAEEAGLVLAADGLGLGGDPIAVVSAAPPAITDLPQVAHWVAPEDVPVRFDARYFAVRAPLGLEPVPDGREAEAAWWARPGDILRDFAAGRCELYWPTLKTMEALATCWTVDELLRMDIPQVEEAG